MNIEQFVARKLEKEADQAKERLTDALGDGVRPTPDDFLTVFPELPGVTGGNWSNLPRGIGLVPYLLVGPAPVLDLAPGSPENFQAATGLTIAQAERLARCGALLPNLYVRNSSEWAGQDHFHGLLELALTNGARVDTFFEAMHPGYAAIVEEHRRELETVFTRLPESKVAAMADAAGIEAKSLIPAFSRRWGYLDVLDPSSSRTVKRLLDAQQFVDLAYWIRLKKHVASPLTSALGGDFVRGRPDVELLRERGWQHPPQTTTEQLIAHRALFDFLIEHFTGLPALPVVAEYQTQKIVDLVETTSFRELKAAHALSLRVLTRRVQTALTDVESSIDERTAQDYKRTYLELSRVLQKYEKWGRIAGGRVGVLVGTLLGGLHGFFTSEVVVFLAEELGALDAGGRAAHKFMHEERHRALMYLDPAHV